MKRMQLRMVFEVALMHDFFNTRFMKSLSLFFSSLVGVVALSASAVIGQEVSQEVKVDVRDIKVQAQNTPQFNVGNVVDKRWKPKVWLEVDVDFEAKKAANPQDKSPVIENLEFKFFVGLNKNNNEGKAVVLTATVTYNNITERENQHALVFASPAALARILEKTNFSTSDVKAVGVEIYKGGALAGWKSSNNQRWWGELANFAAIDGVLIPKNKTPFAPLWGDYDLEAAK